MDNAVAHQLREENKSKRHESIKNEAKFLIASYVDDNHIPTGTDLTEYYQTIGSILEVHFDTAHTYYLARQGFLEYIRSYNKAHELNLESKPLYRHFCLHLQPKGHLVKQELVV